MKKTLLFTVCAAMLLLISCKTLENCTDTILLKGNATTGYMWNAIIDNSGIYEIVNESYKPNDSNKMVGAGGQYSAVIKAVKPGKGAIMFEYKRPWEKESIEKIKFEITVDKKGRVTHKSMTL